ncbi:Flagellar assembly factor FliW [Paenibacillus plantiphilus]|uniref:Flagellar assembly factor FliW n=1 Tax=Paenibacillus plantiphilus TaxID=2905650 RepID=A0ABM9BSU4_9BACL|nr:flagellar assembly protein FliW [Paenibacillus plantiphilus]CAH1192990.1 Flagellar assembly factor FliW [Paenibacillus plantiphilus]
MITIKSSRYGDLTVRQEQVYEFPQGIVGFSNVTEYALMPFEDTDFFVLHASREDVSFILIAAAKVKEDYAFELDEETVRMLETNAAVDVLPFLIVNFVDDVPHINLRAPILIVPVSQKGCQYVIHHPSYPIREALLFEEQGSC